MITKLFLLKTNVLKFTQQKFKHKIQRNKRFNKFFTNVQYASPWLHGTHRNGIPFLILAQTSRYVGLVAALKILSKIYVEHISTSCFYQISKHKTLSPF